MATLQKDAPAHSFAETMLVLNAAFGAAAIERIFLRIDHEPVGSGAIAQVHHAQLCDGSDVAIKVPTLL